MNGIFRIPAVAAIVIIILSALIPMMKRGYRWMVDTAAARAVVFLVSITTTMLYVYFSHDIYEIVRNTMRSGIRGSVSTYINVLFINNRMLNPYEYISLISIGFLIIGMPSVLMNFFSAGGGDKLNRGRHLTVAFFVLFMGIASFFGGAVRGFLYPREVTESQSVFVTDILKMCWSGDMTGKIVAVIFAIGVFTAAIVAVEACMYLIIITVSKDIIKDGRIIFVKDESKLINITCIIVSLMLMILTSFLKHFELQDVFMYLAIIGSTIGTSVLMSLIWKRMNAYGCTAGLVAGFFATPFFQYADIIKSGNEKISICDWLGMNPVLLTALSVIIFIYLISIVTKKPDQETMEIFMDVKNRMV